MDFIDSKQFLMSRIIHKDMGILSVTSYQHDESHPNSAISAIIPVIFL